MIMKKLVLVGGGGHCKSVIDAVLSGGEYDEIIITDPDIEAGTEIMGCTVVGDDESLGLLRNKGYTDAFITVGSIKDTKIRRKLSDKIKGIGFASPVIADPSAVISVHAKIGEGTFIGKNAVINADAKIGNHCIINTGAIIEHECNIGNFCHVAVGAKLCGGVSVGDDSFVGAGTVVIQGKKIGSKVLIGANSTVLSDVVDEMIVYGIAK